MRTATPQLIPLSLICILLPAIRIPLYAQHIDATVTSHVERLASDDQDYVKDLASRLEKAIDDFSFDGYRSKTPLKIRCDLYFEKASRLGAFRKYSAGLLLTLDNGLQLRDKRCEFRYAPEDRIHLGDPYDPLTGIIQFYALIALGFDADGRTQLGGDSFYDKARLLGEMARSEAQYSTGWDDRRELASDISDSVYTQIRRARFYATAAAFYGKVDNQIQLRNSLLKLGDILLSTTPKNAEFHFGDHVFRFVDLDEVARLLKKGDFADLQSDLQRWDYEHADRYR
jgi:hypothetical protein